MLTYRSDAFQHGLRQTMHYDPDAIIAVADGRITHFGPAQNIRRLLPPDTRVEDYGRDSLITAGFIDCHVHFPQTQIIGAGGEQLIDWLNKYTFVAEQRFSDKTYAREVARVFLRECLRHGVTTSAVHWTVHPHGRLYSRKRRSSTFGQLPARCSWTATPRTCNRSRRRHVVLDASDDERSVQGSAAQRPLVAGGPRAFYLATRGAAHAPYLDDTIGSIAAGMEADFVVLDLKSTPLIEYRMRHAADLEEGLFVQMTLADDRAVRAPYVAGRKIYQRA